MKIFIIQKLGGFYVWMFVKPIFVAFSKITVASCDYTISSKHLYVFNRDSFIVACFSTITK